MSQLKRRERVSSAAILIGAMDYRDSDRIVTLFTEEHGVIKAIARGAKRSSRRFAGALELFSRLNVQITLKEGLSTLDEAEVISIFPAIRQDLDKIGYGSYACEIVNALLPEGLPNKRVFRLLEAYLRHLNDVSASAADRRFFEINLLNILGYRPPVSDCTVCGGNLGTLGGVWCRGREEDICCPRCGSGSEKLGADTVCSMLQSLTVGRYGTITFPAEQLQEVGALLDATITTHIQRPLKSLSFLNLSSP